MLAYAANTRPLGRSESPKALALIIAGHALLLGALFMARTEIRRVISDPPDVTYIDPIKPPPPTPVDDVRTPTKPTTSTVDQLRPVVRPLVPQPAFDPGPKTVDVTLYVGPVVEFPVLPTISKADPVKLGPRFITPDSQLRPPYPLAKLRSEEEASLRLRLTIDPHGRVTAVDPVGRADPDFLAAARRHILKAWRYTPATEDGSAVGSSVVITLKFELGQA